MLKVTPRTVAFHEHTISPRGVADCITLRLALSDRDVEIDLALRRQVRCATLDLRRTKSEPSRGSGWVDDAYHSLHAA